MEIRDYLNVVVKRKYIIMACLGVMLLVGAVVNYSIMKPKYQATARVLVEQPTRVLMVGDRSPYAPPPLSVETQVRLIRSLEVGKRAAETIEREKLRTNKLPYTRQQLDTAALGYINRVGVSNEPDTGIINLRVECQTPEECPTIANAFAEAFEKMSVDFAKKAARDATNFIQSQLRIAERDLSLKEKNIFDFNETNGIVSLEEEISKQNMTIVGFENMEIQEQMKIQETDAQIANMQRLLQDKNMRLYRDPSALVDSSWGIGLRKALEDAEMDRATLLLKYKADHPLIKQADEKIRQVQERMQKSVSEMIGNRVIVSDKYMFEKQQLVDMSTQQLLSHIRIGIIKNILSKIKAEQTKYPRIQYQFARLVREKDVAEKLFILLYEKHQQAKIDEVQQDVKVRVLDKAFAPYTPFWPDRKKNMAVMTLFGLLLGVGLAFLLEEMEETVRTSDDVKNYLNLPVLGSIPYSAETINKLITDVPLKSPIAEAYRRLSFFTQLFCLDPPIKTLLMTSSKSDEGKTTTMSNLAISMAQEGTRVLIVDTDMRRPMVHRLFGIDNSLGLSSILSGDLEAEIAVSDLAQSGHLPRESFMEVVVDRIIQPLPIKGLSAITSGPLPANSIELLRSERMLTFLRIIEKKADIVIFDSPPAIHVIDAVVLAQILDGVLLVINSGRISKDEALQVKYMIESTKTPIIGVALNNIEASSPDYYYYYYYGGYGYGTRQRRKRVKLKR